VQKNKSVRSWQYYLVVIIFEMNYFSTFPLFASLIRGCQFFNFENIVGLPDKKS